MKFREGPLCFARPHLDPPSVPRVFFFHELCIFIKFSIGLRTQPFEFYSFVIKILEWVMCAVRFSYRPVFFDEF